MPGRRQDGAHEQHLLDVAAKADQVHGYLEQGIGLADEFNKGVGKAHELAEYFTEDAVLDVDGVVAKGHKEIAKLYQRPEGSETPAAKRSRAWVSV